MSIHATIRARDARAQSRRTFDQVLQEKQALCRTMSDEQIAAAIVRAEGWRTASGLMRTFMRAWLIAATYEQLKREEGTPVDYHLI